MKQCTRLIVKTPCKVSPAKGKPWTLRAGQKFWVTSPEYNNATGCNIDREKKGWPNSGLYFTHQQIAEIFDVL